MLTCFGWRPLHKAISSPTLNRKHSKLTLRLFPLRFEPKLTLVRRPLCYYFLQQLAEDILSDARNNATLEILSISSNPKNCLQMQRSISADPRNLFRESISINNCINHRFWCFLILFKLHCVSCSPLSRTAKRCRITKHLR